MTRQRRFFLFFILAFNCLKVSGQNEYINALYVANKLFESGKIQECIDTLEPSLRYINQKDELFESYHLLARAYQGINQIDKANYFVRKMLKLKPDYKKFSNIDPLDFVHLVNNYKVTPKLYAGLKFGFNINSIALKKSYATYKSTQRYEPATGYQFGICGDYRIKPKLSVNADILLSGIGISHTIDSVSGWKQQYREQQNYTQLNLSVQQHFNLGKRARLNIGFGIGMAYLNASNVFFELRNFETGSLMQATQNPVSMRRRWQKNASGVIGFEIPVSTGVFGLETSFSYFFDTTVKGDKRWNDLNFNLNNHYVNDDISLRLTMVSVSYRMPVYWSIKLQK